MMIKREKRERGVIYYILKFEIRIRYNDLDDEDAEDARTNSTTPP